jgi:hypothetical protein
LDQRTGALALQYSRALTTQYAALLRSDGPLHGLFPLITAIDADDPLALDVQLRGRHGLSLYHGRQVLVSINFNPERRTIHLNYNRQFRTENEHIPVDEPNRVLTALTEFLPRAISQCRHRQCTTFWSSHSLIPGHLSPETDGWLVFDRDAFMDVTLTELKEVVDPVRLKFERIHTRMQAEFPEIWGEPDPRGFGYHGKCDLLALGSASELLCIELLHGIDQLDFPWKLIEAAMAAEFFRMVGASTLEAVRGLVTQKVELGLLPPFAVERIPPHAFWKIVPVLIVVDADSDAAGWKRLARLQQENPALAKVTVAELKHSEDLQSSSPVWRELL